MYIQRLKHALKISSSPDRKCRQYQTSCIYNADNEALLADLWGIWLCVSSSNNLRGTDKIWKKSSYISMQNIKITSLSTLMQHSIHYCMQPARAVTTNDYLCSTLDFHCTVCVLLEMHQVPVLWQELILNFRNLKTKLHLISSSTMRSIAQNSQQLQQKIPFNIIVISTSKEVELM
jgi:hypothetical protein